MRSCSSPKRKAVGSNPAGEAKASDPQMGVACFIFIKGIRTPAGVNRAPVEPESRGQGLRVSAGRIPPGRPEKAHDLGAFFNSLFQQNWV